MLHEERGLRYRKISYELNTWEIKTQRGNKWLPQSVFFILKENSREILYTSINEQVYIQLKSVSSSWKPNLSINPSSD